MRPSARNGLSLASNDSRVRGLHPRVNVPGLLLRFLARGFFCPFGLSAPLPSSGSLRKGPLPCFRPVAVSTTDFDRHAPRLHSPSGFFDPSGIKARQGLQRTRPAFRIRPISSRSPQPFLSLVSAADHRSRSATFPETCCSSNLLEPHSLCSTPLEIVKRFRASPVLFPQILFGLFLNACGRVSAHLVWKKQPE
jgi:hypothetical protein